MSSLQTVAKTLAKAHRDRDASTSTIKFFPDPDGDHVRLLEVSDTAPTTGEVLPFRFTSSPDHGIDFESVIILLSPAEWGQVQAGDLALPSGWDLKQAVDL